MFIDQLVKTLEAEKSGDNVRGKAISGPSGGNSESSSDIGKSATEHGKILLNLGYTIDQVVHDYGDLCQAISDLAVEREVPFEVDEYRTLNRCLDNAIADAVTQFNVERDISIASHQSSDINERIGFLMHELRNSLGSAMLAVAAMDHGNLGISGATGGVLKRSHAAMLKMIERSIHEVRAKNADSSERAVFSLADFIAEAKQPALLDAENHGCVLEVAAVSEDLQLIANRDLLLAALANLLSNAFKFTHHHTMVSLKAYAVGNRILIEVADNCGGLPPGNAEKMFAPFMQNSGDRSGLGLGLSIARQSIEEDGGTLTVQDVPNIGCIFTINLPMH